MSKLPLVLIVGDSISIGYTPFVKKELEGRAVVERHAGNAGDSNSVLEHFQSNWLPALGARPDIIHINCGLHDLRFLVEKKQSQVSWENYSRNMKTLAGQLAAAAENIIWASTTPVLDQAPDMSKDFPRTNSDVDLYNKIASQEMSASGFAINDLNAYVHKNDPAKMINPDGVHFSDAAYAQLGQAVVAAVSAELD
jgi:lysophospholipase L1-like esterase